MFESLEETAGGARKGVGRRIIEMEKIYSTQEMTLARLKKYDMMISQNLHPAAVRAFRRKPYAWTGSGKNTDIRVKPDGQ